jgi:hypothetical protein
MGLVRAGWEKGGSDSSNRALKQRQMEVLDIMGIAGDQSRCDGGVVR